MFQTLVLSYFRVSQYSPLFVNNWIYVFVLSQLNTEWAQVEVIDLINDGSGLGFGIVGGRSTGVVVKTILPGGVADRVSLSIIRRYLNYIQKRNVKI